MQKLQRKVTKRQTIRLKKDVIKGIPKVSELELLFESQMMIAGFPELVREYKFHPVRKWRYDFAYPELKIGIEVEGGTFGGKSRHSFGTGYAKDCEKYNHATLLGWKVYRFTGEMVKKGEAIGFLIDNVLKGL